MNEQFLLYIFDVDGTLVEPKSGGQFRKSADDWQWLPGRVEMCAALRAAGAKIGIASNQGGVAFGLLEPGDIKRELERTGEGIGATWVKMCFSHPKAKIDLYRQDSHRRKPGPGMLNEIIEASGVSRQDTLMVGDRPEDEEAAQAAGVSFMWANLFFGEK